MSAPLHQQFSQHPEVDNFVRLAVWAVGSPFSIWPGAEQLTAEQIIALAIRGYGALAADLQAITVH